MIIVKFKGGLGNQLFQYALGRYMQLKRGAIVKYDLSWFEGISENETKRQFELGAFNTIIEKADNNEIVNLLRKDNSVINKWYRRAFRFYPRDRKHYILEMHKEKPNHRIRNLRTAYLDGYWFSFSYQDQIREQLLRELTPCKETSDSAYTEMMKLIKSSSSVGIHIRRGDFTNQTINGRSKALDLDYFERAIQEVKLRVTNPVYFVYSDDIQWAQSFLSGITTLNFVSRLNLSIADEFTLMSSCQNFIISNSTFSWWASWLSVYDGKIIVAPKIWHHKKGVSDNFEVNISSKQYVRI